MAPNIKGGHCVGLVRVNFSLSRYIALMRVLTISRFQITAAPPSRLLRSEVKRSEVKRMLFTCTSEALCGPGMCLVCPVGGG